MIPQNEYAVVVARADATPPWPALYTDAPLPPCYIRSLSLLLVGMAKPPCSCIIIRDGQHNTWAG
jgi:hypothetical protein